MEHLGLFLILVLVLDEKSPKLPRENITLLMATIIHVMVQKAECGRQFLISFRPGPTCPPEHTGSQAESCLRPQWISWTQVGSSCRWRTEKELQHHRLDSDPQVGSRFRPGEITSNNTFFTTEVVAAKFPFLKS